MGESRLLENAVPEQISDEYSHYAHYPRQRGRGGYGQFEGGEYESHHETRYEAEQYFLHRRTILKGPDGTGQVYLLMDWAFCMPFMYSSMFFGGMGWTMITFMLSVFRYLFATFSTSSFVTFWSISG